MTRVKGLVEKGFFNARRRCVIIWEDTRDAACGMMKRARGGSGACVQRTHQLRLARMHVEMAGAGSISHSLLLAFLVLKSSPGPTNHLFRLEHNDNAGSPLNGLVRR